MSGFLIDATKRAALIIILGAIGVGAWHAYQRHRLANAAEISVPAGPDVLPRSDNVAARGRIEPHHGVRRIAGPSSMTFTAISRLFVDEGDMVHTGQLLAVIDTHDVLAAVIEQREAELANARREYERSATLNREKLASTSETELLQTRVAVAEAALKRARADFELTEIRSPIDGRVLRVRTRPGEQIGPSGIVELGETSHMYVIAEVYETDASRLRVGQRATIASPALPTTLTGTLERVRLKVEKQDAIGTDPATRKDARVIEALIALDASADAAPFTNMQVEVVIRA